MSSSLPAHSRRSAFTLIELLVVIAIERHGRGVNFVFFDQHVSAVRPARELWALKWHKSYQRHGHDRTKIFPAWMR